MRHILHMDLDTFFVSVERLQNSKLNGLPVIIGGMGDRGVVAGCSYEARRFGVHSAMPMKMARQLCSDAVYIRGDMEQYSKYSNIVTDIIAERVPVYEKASIDEHYIDLTGMDRFFGCQKWAHELRQTHHARNGVAHFVRVVGEQNRVEDSYHRGQALRRDRGDAIGGTAVP
jgi:DNA polymerase IV